MTIYKRPHFDVFLGKPAAPGRRAYPYPERMLRSCDIFELFPLDGGASFFTNQHIGDRSTRRFIEAFESGELLAPWAGGRRGVPAAGDLDWFAAYDPESGPWAPGQKTEQHVWLHRLYFLLPIAQEHMRGGKRAWARRWFEFFREWRTRFPGMGDPTGGKAKHSAYIWHDMQVAWRLLVFIHSVHMMGGGTAGKSPLKAAEWAEVYRAVHVHAKWVYAEAKEGLSKNATGNHFLQKGTALIFAGTLFPELDGAAEWVKTGRLIIRDQMRREINADGGSIEASPSYSHFIAGLYLAAFLVLDANGRPPIPGLAKSIRRQYAFLEGTMSPSGRSLQVGDSYSLDARRDLAIVRRLFPLPASRARKSRCFPESRFIVLQSPGVAVYIDAADVRCGHIHAPKPNMLVYHRGRPAVVECGCVNYDLPEYKTGHIRTWAAHNVVAPESFLGDPKAGRDIKLRIAGFAPASDGGVAEIECRYSGEDAAFAWRRTVKLSGDVVEILDRVTSERAAPFVLSLHLDPAHSHLPDVILSALGGRVLPVEKASFRAVNEANRLFSTRTVRCRQAGDRLLFRTVLAF